MAEERKRTPGPWRKIACPEDWSVESPFCDFSWFTIGSTARATDSDAPVAFVSYSDADARLIAAAPDLLAALQELMQIREWSIRAGGMDGPLPRDVIVKFAEMQIPAVDRARAAIKRATEG